MIFFAEMLFSPLCLLVLDSDKLPQAPSKTDSADVHNRTAAPLTAQKAENPILKFPNPHQTQDQKYA